MCQDLHINNYNCFKNCGSFTKPFKNTRVIKIILSSFLLNYILFIYFMLYRKIISL